LVAEIIRRIGEDPDRQGLVRTPERVKRAMALCTSGYAQAPEDVMTGALFGMSVFQDDRNFDVGHIMIAIDPRAFMGEAEFQKRLEELVAEVKGAPAIDPQRPVLLPGEIEFKRMEERRRDGVPVARETVEGLRELAQMLDVDFPL